MPVLVTAAQTPLGRAVVARLLDLGGQVRAFVTGDGRVADLRARGAVVATGDLDDEGHLEAAMAQVHTVVHVGHGLLSASAEAVLAEGATVVTAAIGAGVRRLVVVSAAGAAPDATDPYRRALGLVEDLARLAPIPSVALRCSLVAADDLLDVIAAVRPGSALDATQVAPLAVEDVADVVRFLDEVRSEAHEGHVVMRLQGPATLTLGELRQRLVGAAGFVGRTYRPAEDIALATRALSGPWLEGGDWPDAAAVAGIRLSGVA